MNKDVKEAIEKTADAVTEKMKCKNLIRDSSKTAYQKTETLLYSYIDFLQAIKNREEEINEIREHGLRKHSNSILPASNDIKVCSLTDQEKADMMIDELESSVAATKRCVSNLDRIMSKYKADPYYQAIMLKYMNQMSRSEISKIMDIPERTLSRGCSKLVKKISIELFTDQVIREILYGV